MIKTYENFLDKFWKKLTSPESSSSWSSVKNFEGDWNDVEMRALKQFGNIRSDNPFEYDSVMNDISIKITKYFEEEVPGYAETIYKIRVNDKTREFRSFEKLVKYLQEIISQEELDANKYNL